MGRSTRGRTSLGSTFPALINKSSSANFPAVNATACILRSCSSRLERAVARRTVERSRRRYFTALEEGIANYAGCVVVISHDRWFLDRLATHTRFEGDGIHW
jgi:hypothetical protein